MDWSYEYERHYFFLSLPLEGDGALETFLLNAMEHETGNIFFSQQSKHFVKEIIEKKKNSQQKNAIQNTWRNEEHRSKLP